MFPQSPSEIHGERSREIERSTRKGGRNRETEPNGLYVRLRFSVYPLLFLWRGGGGFAAFPPDYLACAQRMPPSIGVGQREMATLIGSSPAPCGVAWSDVAADEAVGAQ